ncbi:hypothetical protein OsJ_30455 [Oryza sativa Japonica Group]|uniref:Uncharacterized protein n=1 Tax=Oryza sativa subsp. japonica TaxID=39947 RepID=A3C1T4_ORYSJ|nr:hypothetical protein OsJ_30455 [Oryza sativa Japonica Group]
MDAALASRRHRLLLAAAAAAAGGYGLYRLYRHHRRRVAAVLSLADAVSQLLAAFTDPKHEAKLKDLLVSVCNGAVETLVRTRRQVAVAPPPTPIVVVSEAQSPHGCVMDTVSSTLAVPSNRRFVLDITGRVTAETVRSLLDFLAQRVSDGARKSIATARNEGFLAIKHITSKSMAIFTICFALCMHISMGTRFLLPP